jgi:hypothetical protein
MSKKRADTRDQLATEIGQLALEWNYLHELLSFVFGMCVTGTVGGACAAIWHSTANDRAQREMLRAVARQPGTKRDKFLEPYRDDVLWLLKEMDALADQRNNAIHSPFMIHIGNDGQESYRPMEFLGNRRAKRLNEKPDILAEIAWCKERATVLGDFVAQMMNCMTNGGPPPARPRLPQPRVIPLRD